MTVTDWQEAYFDAVNKVETETIQQGDLVPIWNAFKAMSQEIARLRGAFLETREMLGLAEQVICEECCPTTWKTADGQPHSPLHEDIRAVLFKHEATRDEARAALGDSHD